MTQTYYISSWCAEDTLNPRACTSVVATDVEAAIESFMENAASYGEPHESPLDLWVRVEGGEPQKYKVITDYEPVYTVYSRED